MRVFEPDAPPAYPHRSWPRTRGVSHPLEVASGSPYHRAGLFGAAFDDGKADRSWSQTAGSRRVDSRSGRSTPKAAWPQTAIGSRGVACAPPPEANTESPLASTLSLLSFIRYTADSSKVLRPVLLGAALTPAQSKPSTTLVGTN